MTLANYEGRVYDDETNQSLQQPAASVAAYRRSLALAQARADVDKSNAEAASPSPSPAKTWPLSTPKSPRRALRHLAYALQRNRQMPAARLAIEEAIAVQTCSLAEQKSDASEKAQVELSQRVLAGLIESPSL